MYHIWCVVVSGHTDTGQVRSRCPGPQRSPARHLACSSTNPLRGALARHPLVNTSKLCVRLLDYFVVCVIPITGENATQILLRFFEWIWLALERFLELSWIRINSSGRGSY
jgi:hypothetical protein